MTDVVARHCDRTNVRIWSVVNIFSLSFSGGWNWKFPQRKKITNISGKDQSLEMDRLFLNLFEKAMMNSSYDLFFQTLNKNELFLLIKVLKLVFF